MQPISYARHQFPAEVIRHAVWLYLRFPLSYRDAEELLAERGIEVSYENPLDGALRRWRAGGADDRDQAARPRLFRRGGKLGTVRI
jgi:hypothetical protein